MTEQMMQEILDDWMSWKYDIWEANTTTWTQRDDSKVHMIGVILQEKMKEIKGDK
tara:strand:+ start:157 stop:321 length:165 start_codon:yes stop_codon:yes gene_type:complete